MCVLPGTSGGAFEGGGHLSWTWVGRPATLARCVEQVPERHPAADLIMAQSEKEKLREEFVHWSPVWNCGRGSLG